MTRAAGRALGASLAVVDRSTSVLAIAARSPDEEDKLRGDEPGVENLALTYAEQAVGELRYRWHEAAAPAGLLDLIAALIAMEVHSSRSGDWADEEAAAAFTDAVLEREIVNAEEILAQAADFGCDLSDGGGVVIGRFRAEPEREDGWQAKALTAATRGLRSVARGTLVATLEDDELAEIRAIVPVADTTHLERAARDLQAEAERATESIALTIGHSRHVDRAPELFRAGKEALLALNVAESEQAPILAFEATGSYRLLLSTMSENPAELEWFYADTIAPLVGYDQQYGTDLVATVETFLRNDGNIGPTAEELFAHRHTIRYRLGRVRDLCGYDIQSTDGRERLGFGLKVMRVLGRDALDSPREQSP